MWRNQYLTSIQSWHKCRHFILNMICLENLQFLLIFTLAWRRQCTQCHCGCGGPPTSSWWCDSRTEFWYDIRYLCACAAVTQYYLFVGVVFSWNYGRWIWFNRWDHKPKCLTLFFHKKILTMVLRVAYCTVINIWNGKKLSSHVIFFSN